MLWIIGFRRTNKRLWLGQITCRRCLQRRLHQLNEEAEWGTLFFVPIVPIRRERLLVCQTCGLPTKLTKIEVQQLMAEVPSMVPPER